MAKRLATEYVFAKLRFKHSEMPRFLALMEEQQLNLQALVLDNGNQELHLRDVAGQEEIILIFEREREDYVCRLTCRVVELKLTNALRKAVSTFRGNALVNRIYSHYTMIYHYTGGTVRRIVEQTKNGQRLIFEHKDTLGQLESMYRSAQIERKIELLQGAVNELLDDRNRSMDDAEMEQIDGRLKVLAHQLFVLEA